MTQGSVERLWCGLVFVDTYCCLVCAERESPSLLPSYTVNSGLLDLAMAALASLFMTNLDAII